MIHHKFLSLILTAAMATAVLIAQPHAGFAAGKKFKLPMVEDPSVAVWTYEPHGEMMIAAMIQNIDGKVAVCGFWTISKRVSPYVRESGLLRKTRGNASVYIGDIVVMRSLRTFNSVPLEEFAVGTPANCAVTNQPWHASFSNKNLRVGTPRLTAID